MSNEISDAAWTKVLAKQVSCCSYYVTKRGGPDDVEQVRMYEIGSNAFVKREEALAAQADLDADERCGNCDHRLAQHKNGFCKYAVFVIPAHTAPDSNLAVCPCKPDHRSGE